MDLSPFVGKLDVLSKNLAAATNVRERVRIADRIFETLGEIEQSVEMFVVTEIGQRNGNAAGQRQLALPPDSQTAPKHQSDRFAGLDIADAAFIVLKEHGVLHGKEIETMLRGSGQRSKAKNFQKSMYVAFMRDGRFKNVGGNRWTLQQE